MTIESFFSNRILPQNIGQDLARLRSAAQPVKAVEPASNPPDDQVEISSGSRQTITTLQNLLDQDLERFSESFQVQSALSEAQIAQIQEISSQTAEINDDAEIMDVLGETRTFLSLNNISLRSR